MKYVYLLKSEIYPSRYYVGCTGDLKKRLAEHNRGESTHTKKFLPWRLISYFAFEDHDKADAFEAYLKTASGRAFSKKHF